MLKGETEAGRERELPSAGLFSKCLQWPRARNKAGWDSGTQPRSSMWEAGNQPLKQSPLPVLTGCWIQETDLGITPRDCKAARVRLTQHPNPQAHGHSTLLTVTAHRAMLRWRGPLQSRPVASGSRDEKWSESYWPQHIHQARQHQAEGIRAKTVNSYFVKSQSWNLEHPQVPW